MDELGEDKVVWGFLWVLAVYLVFMALGDGPIRVGLNMLKSSDVVELSCKAWTTYFENTVILSALSLIAPILAVQSVRIGNMLGWRHPKIIAFMIPLILILVAFIQYKYLTPWYNQILYDAKYVNMYPCTYMARGINVILGSCARRMYEASLLLKTIVVTITVSTVIAAIVYDKGEEAGG